MPVESGPGSSRVLLVSVITVLNEVFDLGFSPKDIAKYVYIAEHNVIEIPHNA